MFGPNLIHYNPGRLRLWSLRYGLMTIDEIKQRISDKKCKNNKFRRPHWFLRTAWGKLEVNFIWINLKDINTMNLMKFLKSPDCWNRFCFFSNTEMSLSIVAFLLPLLLRMLFVHTNSSIGSFSHYGIPILLPISYFDKQWQLRCYGNVWRHLCERIY